MNAIPIDLEQEVLGENSEYTVLKSKSIFSSSEKNKSNIHCEPDPEKNNGYTVNTSNNVINHNDANLTDPRV